RDRHLVVARHAPGGGCARNRAAGCDRVDRDDDVVLRRKSNGSRSWHRGALDFTPVARVEKGHAAKGRGLAAPHGSGYHFFKCQPSVAAISGGLYVICEAYPS